MTVVLLLASLLAQASDVAPAAGSQSTPAQPATGDANQTAPDVPSGAAVVERTRPPRLKVAPIEPYLAPTGETVDANDILDEMIDEATADLARLGTRVAPILLERIRLSDNLNPDLASVIEARLAASLGRAANVALVRCTECWATRGRLEHGAWIVSRGINRRDDLVAVANKYSARTLLTVAVTLQEAPSTLAMDVELVRADDSSVAFAEQYRMTPDNALLYRGVERSQSRTERLKQLEDRINNKPRFGHAAEFGAMVVGSTGNSIPAAVGRYQLTERFGEDGLFDAGLSVGGFFNTGTIAAAMIGANWSMRLTPAQLAASELRLTAGAGGIVTGSATSTYASAGLRYRPAVRITLHAGIHYLVAFDAPTKPPRKYGGSISPELGLGFSWQ
ncbi:MAG: hypothetical protein E6J85_13135 [Deltaproteobacteria bacterium]|nr:MAG: hypothetical protein E6J85_13135 [Deltaproteobacteria bacterium]TMB29164.1 MAG: hypothetical protein E6J61_16135 [Deltaproteobacteria bacterium]